jgi:two-component system phosphate regulon sensor histidine kinase PhoR
MVAALSSYLGWHLLSLYRLDLWLQARRTDRPPKAYGIWAQVYDNLYNLKLRNRQGKRRLAQFLSRFREAAEALPDGAVALGPERRILWYNSAAARMLGLRRRDLNRPISNLVRDPEFSAFLRAGRFDGAAEVRSPVNESVQLSTRLVNYDENQDLLLCADITRLRNLERIRRDFVSNMSHELRTPLTVLSGYAESMLDSGEFLDSPWQKPLQHINQQAVRMFSVVEDLLTLSRLESGGRRQPDEPVPVHAILAAIREDALSLSGSRAHAVTLSADASEWLLGQERELRSAFSNLVFNAVRYTPDGGRIDMHWYRDEDGSLCLSVTDDGEGIPAQHLSRLTERFYRVDVARSREAGGTGLGLAIVKHVLLRHDARLEIQSQIGQGSVFTCRFNDKRGITPGRQLAGQNPSTMSAFKTAKQA